MTSLDKTALEAAKSAIRTALTETWQDSINVRSWDQDILLTGCRAAKYEQPTEAAENLAVAAATASVSAYLSHAAGDAEFAIDDLVANAASSIATQIESHDAFDCPDGWTYHKAAHHIATDLAEKVLRPMFVTLSVENARLEKVVKDLSDEISSLEEEGCDADDTIMKLDARTEAAEARVKAQAALIEQAREALEALGRLANEVFRDGMNSRRRDDDAVWGFDRVNLTYGALRLIQSTLTQFRESINGK